MTRPTSPRLRLASIALTAVALGAACLQGATAPQVPPRGTLAPGEQVGSSPRSEGPFAVVFGAPKGQTDDPSEITLVFNRPMRPLDLAGQEAPAPVVMKPEVKGRWQWVGTSGLVFAPEGHLPRATTFTVEVPAGTRALDGSTLAEPYRLTFSTARPAVARTEPYDRSDDIKPSTTFELRWNQPVSDQEIARAVAITAGEKAARVAFNVRRPDPKNPRIAALDPKAPLPLDAEVRLTVDASLRGLEGPLAAGREQAFQFHTYGPLRVQESTCDTDTPHGRCAPDGGFSIELSNPVRLRDLKSALRVEPATKLTWSSWLDDDAALREVHVHGRFTPGKTYRVRLAANGIRDEHGQALARDWSKELAFDDRWPSAGIGLTGSIFEPGVKREIPVGSLNVKDLELATAPLTEGDILALEANENQPGRPPSIEAIASLPGGKRVTRRPTAAMNTPAVEAVRTEDVLGGKDKRGPIAIGLAYTERPGTSGARLVTRSAIAQVTDLAISAKISPFGSLVWVTRLSTAAPVEGAAVSIRRPPAKGGAATTTDVFRTDANGFAVIPAPAFQPARDEQERAVVFARTDTDWSYRRVDDALSAWRYGVSVDFSEDRPFGMLFTERGIYRPGDVVRVKGIFRQEGHPPALGGPGAAGKGAASSTTTPAGRAVHIVVAGPDGDEIAKASPVLSAFGTVAADITIPATSRLGTYSLQASVEGSPRGWADVTEDFEVAEYRPASFQVAVESDKPSYVRGDKATCVARGDYLFGAPMVNADVSHYVRRETTRFTPPGFEDLPFTFEEDPYFADLTDQSPREDEIETARGKLDAKGTQAITAALAMPGQRGVELMTCEAEVTDVARQSIAGSTSAIVHPAAFYIGLNPGPDLFIKTGDSVRPEIIAVDPRGARVRGVAVHVELIQRSWNLARQKTGGGALHSVSTAVDRVVQSCDVTTADAPAACPLTPTGAGYFLLRATAADKRKNPVGAAASLYVTGQGSAGWGDSDKLSLDLVPDKKFYKVGDTARVLVKSPFTSADAWVTVERAGVYTRRRVTLSGPTPTLDVPITEDLRPNAFVSVLLVRGRSKAPPAGPGGPGGKAAADVGAPAFRLGYAELRIDPEPRTLRVALRSSKADYRPGEQIKVDVDVRDHRGQPARAEVTLYAVDEGVLSLIGYETPDPVRVFGAPRSLKVSTLETRASLAKVHRPFANLGLDKGLDGGSGASSMDVRRDFRASAYYHPALVTNDKGHVEASFKLPDSLTTYRLMAVTVAEDDRFGYAESHVTTSRPLMARPAFPRVLRAGDTLDAGVVVTSKGLAKAPVEVEIAAEGLEVRGPSKRSIDLAPGASVEVRFALAAPRVGAAKVRFKVRGGGAEDAVEIAREVLAPTSLEAVALYGDTTDASAEKLGDLSAIRGDVGGLTVSLSSTALVGLGGGVEQLIEYPYGCTEQLTSRLVPLLPLRDLARDFKLPLPGNLDGLVAGTVAKILGSQRGDGGFGLWTDSAEANTWVTAYALWGLSEAKRRGTRVPGSAIESATRFVRGALEEVDTDPYALASAPFILEVLAENGAPDAGRASRLYEDRRKLPLFAKAQLARALTLGKGDKAAVAQLVSEIEGHLRIDGPRAYAASNTGDAYAVLMDSDTRTSALVLRALLAARPSHPMASRLAMGLLAARSGGTWRSTQETAWALLALDEYRRAQEKAAPDFTARVFLGQAEVAEAPFRGRSADQARVTLPAANLASAAGAPLAFDVEGQGRLFYEARLRYARKQLPTQPIERGFFVTKTLRVVTPEGLEEALGVLPAGSARAFKGGDLVLADVVVVAPQPREFVVIDDPLPAGFEAVDARLATTARGLDVDAAAARGDDEEEQTDEERDDAVATKRAYQPSRFIREIRDDRVLFFVDHMAAGMYRYRYLARATTLGAFVLPPTKAEEMYTPEVFGRTAAGTISIAASP